MKLIACLLALGMAGTVTAQRSLRMKGNGKKRGRETTEPGENLKYFDRVATFPVCRQLDAGCNDGTQTVAEIVVVTDDGMTAVYTDAERQVLGFVDIEDPRNPLPLGTIDLPGEPTSVAIRQSFALVVVNDSASFTDTGGILLVVDIENVGTPTIVREIQLGGQPDSIGISPDDKYAVIAIENERDEDLGDGEVPQLPAGFVLILDIEANDPTEWPDPTVVDITGLDGVYENSDPEPEFVSINEDNIAVVTLQENNAAVLIDVTTQAVIDSFSMGSVDLENMDSVRDGVIDMTGSILGVVREPDGVTWIHGDYFVTANEGDMLGGSRGFTIFDKDGNVVYDPGSSFEYLNSSFGHYPEGRSHKKGSEVENVVYAKNLKLLFVQSERASTIIVFDVIDPSNPKFHQVLPSEISPEGGYYIESRNLFIAACEVDFIKPYRASLIIYEYGSSSPSYPTLMSVEDGSIGNGVPIGWGAISGLSPPSELTAETKTILYAVDDRSFKKSRIFTIYTSSPSTKTSKAAKVPKNSNSPAMITEAMHIKDDNGVFAAFPPYGDFTAAERDDMINDDKTVNLDSEGIVATSSGFWIASEGRGTVGDDDEPIESLNLLFKLDTDGVIEEVISLPDAVNDIQFEFGFEGVTVDGDYVVVAFQRAWGDEANPRLGIYNMQTEVWKFVFYPLDEPESPNGKTHQIQHEYYLAEILILYNFSCVCFISGGWVGLSEISSLGDGDLLVLERDNQGGSDAAIKRIYSVSLGDLDMVADGDQITKSLIRDVLGDTAATGGMPLEKFDGMAVLGRHVWIVNDNGGVKGSNGETQLLNLGKLEISGLGRRIR
eukprot:CAMPEP_0201663340 /NCGR_PEP_ID=MMETSP0494-20130426/5175_1 /ASSEMBLY_ACC=CAM_ASM_000839 /TAXON_ID=420259 /ORGANISM="Thalassiosira gravida, Strain GMp14c1" /LENGTH=831 /DNA_ID=CAMNT_0048141913 /DNA_START=276 /DNA_END=2772 /DNA_ORIENTATION=+